MNWFRAAVVMVALLVSGCGGGSATHAVRTRGVLVRVGGPAPGGPVAMPGVRLHFQGDGVSANVRTDRHGRFVFDAPPGTYTVSVRTGGVAPVTVPHVVHIRHAGRLRLVVSIK